MKSKFTLLAIAAFVLLSLPAFALDLHQARSSGLVGEKTDGYIAAIKSSPEVQALVDQVNSQRRQEYARISREKGQPIDTVARLAAQEIINGLQPGNFYQTPDGNWKKR